VSLEKLLRVWTHKPCRNQTILKISLIFYILHSKACFLQETVIFCWAFESFIAFETRPQLQNKVLIKFQ